jgi:hypothetical protein
VVRPKEPGAGSSSMRFQSRIYLAAIYYVVFL